jgi:ParB family transcriptional regulator, chromosome partitioning protein
VHIVRLVLTHKEVPYTFHDLEPDMGSPKLSPMDPSATSRLVPGNGWNGVRNGRPLDRRNSFWCVGTPSVSNPRARRELLDRLPEPAPLREASLSSLSRIHSRGRHSPASSIERCLTIAFRNAHDALVEEHGDEPPEAVLAELEALCDRIDALSTGTVVWDPEDIARAGVIIGIGHGGRLAIERGLVRREDERAGSSASPHGDGEPKKSEARSQKREPHSLSDRLVEDLTAHRTAALRMMLVSNAEIALTAIVHGSTLSLFYRDGVDTCLAVRIDGVDLRGSAETIEETAAAKALAERHDGWRQLLPAAAEDLWAWLLSQETTVRLDLLAHCAGCAVDAVRRPHEDASSGRLVHADQLACAVNLDMAQWWQPTGTSYLGRVPKARILEAMTEGVSREAAENLAKLKKDALVAHAEERLAGTGWLPAILRSPPCAATASS